MKAPEGSHILINKSETKFSHGVMSAIIPLTGYKNIIGATNTKKHNTKKIEVYRLKNFAGKYRVSVDDAIWFLKDIHTHTTSYISIFDNPFLKFLKQLHDDYGTKVHINIFYETEGFNLSQMTDTFKSEWRGNADWLKLSFHAKAELPDDPYIKAGYDQVKSECREVITQIKRFAGEELVDPVTTLHWGQVPVEVSRGLRDAGYTVQVCDFNVDDHKPPCSYYLTVEQRRHMNKRFVWRDNKEGIIFIKSAIIIDTVKLDKIVPFLDQYAKQSRKPPYADLLVHEQYFYPEYPAYQPDYCQKVLAAVNWAKGNDYTPAFLSECLFN